MQGTLFVANQATFVLFDCGATHSFISVNFAEFLHIPVKPLHNTLEVYNPIGKNTICAAYVPELDVVLADQTFTGLCYPASDDGI